MEADSLLEYFSSHLDNYESWSQPRQVDEVPRSPFMTTWVTIVQLRRMTRDHKLRSCTGGVSTPLIVNWPAQLVPVSMGEGAEAWPTEVSIARTPSFALNR